MQTHRTTNLRFAVWALSRKGILYCFGEYGRKQMAIQAGQEKVETSDYVKVIDCGETTTKFSFEGQEWWGVHI
jgi:hypothetical protein